jgi:hypothetical protein
LVRIFQSMRTHPPAQCELGLECALQCDSGTESGIASARLRGKNNVRSCYWRYWKNRYLGRKSYPKGDVPDVIHPITPQFTLRWLAIAGACISLSQIRSIGRGRVGDGKILLQDISTCQNQGDAPLNYISFIRTHKRPRPFSQLYFH